MTDPMANFTSPDIDYHLLPGALPLAQCDVCRRKSWALDDVGAVCSMTGPCGRCGGEMCGRVDGLVAMVRHLERFVSSPSSPEALKGEQG